MEEYWMFTLVYNNTIASSFFDTFPSKQDLKEICGGEAYAIISITQLTEEQYNKLTQG